MKEILFNNNWMYAPGSYEFLSTPTEAFANVNLPHDAMIHEKRKHNLPDGRNTGFYPHGIYEYKKTFLCADNWRQRKQLLLFEGVYAGAKVYVNHMYAGGCLNGYIPFTIDLGPYLKDGENEISVLCRNYRDSRWYSGAGIYRNVYLLDSEQVYFPYGKSNIVTKEISEKHAVLEANVYLRNDLQETKKLQLNLTITDKHGVEICHNRRTVTLFAGEEKNSRQRLTVPDPDLWDTENPNIYKAQLTLCEDQRIWDTEEFTFGIRVLSLSSEDGLKINGKSVKLRGTCIHADNGILGTAAYYTSAYRRIFRLKQAGINAVRIAHHPAGREMLEVCDRLGMLVMNEGFDAWTVCKNPYDSALYFENEWEKITDQMVRSSMNHPSVIMYSLGNEIIECGNPQGAQVAWRLNERIKKLDPDRYTILCLNVLLCMMEQQHAGQENESKDVNEAMTTKQHVFKSLITSPEVAAKVEEAMGYADIVGYNYGDSRYLLDEKDYPDRILCGTETFSEDLSSNWKIVTKHSQILGDFNWTGWDYIGECGIGMMEYDKKENDFWRLAFCGDFDLIGIRRAQSCYREAVWGQAKHPWIFVQDPQHFQKKPERTPWSFFDGIPSWDFQGQEGKKTTVQIYSDADEVELVLNGNSFGKKKAGASVSFVTEYEIPYEDGELRVIAYKNGQRDSEWALRSGKGEISIAVRESAEHYKDDIRYFEVSAEYENGVIAVQQSSRICARVSNGELLAFGNADPKGTDPYDSDECNLFQGRALAVLKGNNAEIKINFAESGKEKNYETGI